MSSPDGTVVVTTFNRSARVGRTTERLLGLADRWPVVVVDDASEDDTSASLRQRFRAEIADGRLRVITLDRNQGGAARTVAVAASDTEVIAFADDDSWWSDGALDEAARTFRAHPDLGLLAATVLVEPGRTPDPIVQQLADSPLPSRPPGPSVLGFLACGAVVRRRAYLQAGGFHRSFHIGGEEELLAIDLRAAGWRVVHVPGVVAHHEPSASDDGRDGRGVRLVRNHLLVQWLRRPLRRALRATVAVGARGPAGRIGRRALVEALAHLPVVLRERRVAPDEVETDIRRLEQRSVA